MKFNLSTDKGAYRVTFTYQGKRKILYLGTSDLLVATRLKARMEHDWLEQRFDWSFESYKAENLNQAPTWVQNTLKPSELYEKWVESLSLSQKTFNFHYRPVLNLLRVHQDSETMVNVLRDTYNANSFNQRLFNLRQFGEWCYTEGHWPNNPYREVKTLKSVKRIVEVFTKDELDKILEYFKSHANGHYYDFVYFLIHSGCRPSEAIGLRWKDVDIDGGKITIAESLSRDAFGSGGSGKRERKERKNGQVTVLQLNDEMIDWVLSLKAKEISKNPASSTGIPVNPESLLFRSPTGLVINDNSFTQSVWKVALERLNIPYRVLYCLRHTFASHCLQQGYSIPQVAYMLGHVNLKQVQETYGHLVDKPVLPNIAQ